MGRHGVEHQVPDGHGHDQDQRFKHVLRAPDDPLTLLSILGDSNEAVGIAARKRDPTASPWRCDRREPPPAFAIFDPSRSPCLRRSPHPSNAEFSSLRQGPAAGQLAGSGSRRRRMVAPGSHPCCRRRRDR
eukprot:scaffold1421_cov255-Pinguiococcus_pyrenoidosus.AAC.2